MRKKWWYFLQKHRDENGEISGCDCEWGLFRDRNVTLRWVAGQGLDGWWWWCRFWWGWGLFVTFRWGFWGFWWVKRLMVIGHGLLSVSYLCLHSVSVSQWRFQCLMKVWIRMRILIRIRIVITKTLMNMWVGDMILTQENNQDECCNVKRCNTM